MTQFKRDRVMFNAEIKERFLATYDEETAKTNRYVFLKTAEKAEAEFNKDLYDFTESEIESLLYGLEARSFQSISSYVAIISRYLDWCKDKEQNLVYDRRNILDQHKFQGQELIKYIDTIALNNKYITKEEFDELIKIICMNDQDRAMFALIYLEGVKGEGLCELKNLRENDLEGNLLTLTDNNGNVRTIEISNETREIIKEAIKEEEYYSYITSDIARVKFRNLQSTGYVFKKSSKVGGDKIGYQTLLQRFKKVAEEFNNAFLTVEGLYWSGIFNMARKIKDDKGELTEQDYDKITEKFNYPTKHVQYRYKLVNTIQENI